MTIELMVYRTGLVHGETGDNYLAYRVEVINRKNIRDIVFLHAASARCSTGLDDRKPSRRPGARPLREESRK